MAKRKLIDRLLLWGMINMDRKLFGMVCFVLAIVIIVTSGASFAYYTSSDTDDNISGTVNDFDVDMVINTVYQADQLIPLNNSLVKSAISK